MNLAPPITAKGLRAKESTAYDDAKYGSIIDWTRSSVLIHGRPTYIVSAEFHYFRVPDRERWRPILLQIKGAGFNCIRLYFHWGYHCPAEGVYNFRGNRDLDYLLTVCRELELFVITAPGPYICAEVQAGGYPLWLIAKRHLRIRHLKHPPVGLIKKFDEEFHNYCVEYMKVIMPILVKYERTNTKDGPIIAMQVENELREGKFGIGGLNEELRLVAQLARECGSTVPFFHNDDNPIGSWSTGKPGKDGNPTNYRTDLYGFDLYFTFPPGDKSGDRSSLQVGMIELCGVSACINTCGVGGVGVGGSDTKYLSCLYYHDLKHAPPPACQWVKDKQMPPATDKLEKNFNKMGGSAANCPTVCAELQVGWINQWGRLRTYDDVYNFFGNDFSATLLTSLASQGISIVNHYMTYGGTNHGSIGDTEVYTSYDYSAFIREYGFLSERGRRLRFVNLFVRSFAAAGLAASKPIVSKSRKSRGAFARVKSTLPDSLLCVREAEYNTRNPPRPGTQSPMFAFLRNLSEGESSRFSLIVDDVVLPVYLPVNQAMIAPLYMPLPKSSSLSIFACSVPVVMRDIYCGTELWVLRVREAEKGHIIFHAGQDTQPGSQAIQAQWARLTSINTGDPMDGVTIASDKDEGAATSFLKAALEELPLSDFDLLGDSRAPIGMRASTESVGLCFTIGFSGVGTSVVSLTSGEDDSDPFLRLLCLDERDADTFAADLSFEEPYLSPGAPDGSFSAAWGVNEAMFTPEQTLEIRHGHNHAESSLFLMREKWSGEAPPESFAYPKEAVHKVMPNLFVHSLPKDIIPNSLKHGIDSGDPMNKSFELELEGLQARTLDWTEDMDWKSISYAQRDPLDHLMTSGHVAYRLRFRTTTRNASLVLNVRHAAMVWCNGYVVGRQICFSHNAMSAGSMHAVDLHQAGKKRHSLSKAMREREAGRDFDEVIILVFSCGQSRQPFLLNDVRNKRGLLSAKLKCRGRVTDAQWYIAGVDTSRTDDAFGSCGLPFEDDAIDFSADAGFAPVPQMDIAADKGVSFFRGTFKVPANSVIDGSILYPLRLKVLSAPGVVAMIWVNGLLTGRYVADLGPQSDFYIPAGLIKECKKNALVIAAYGDCDSTLSIKIVPWVVDPVSGNIDDAQGEVFVRRCVSFSLRDEKLVAPS